MRNGMAGHSTFAGRMLNRLSGEIPSLRPPDDAGYFEFGERLKKYMETASKGPPPARKREPSFIELLRNRELGFPSGRVSSFPCFATRSLYFSTLRNFEFGELQTSNGVLLVQDDVAVDTRARLVRDLRTGDTLCTLNMLREHEKVVSFETVEISADLKNGKLPCSPNWLVLLTNRGRVIFYDYSSRKSVDACYQLDADQFKFRTISPNVCDQSLCVYGHKLKDFVPRALSSESIRDAETVVAVFDIYPVTLKGMFLLPNEIFGSVMNVRVISDVIIVFKRRPYEVVMYNLKDVLNNGTFIVFDPWEGADEEFKISCNVKIAAEPQPYLRIDGNFSLVEFSGVPYHMLGVPCSSRGSYVIKSVDYIRSGQPPPVPAPESNIKLPFGLRVEENNALELKSPGMTFHANESGRIFRFEGGDLVSYSMHTDRNAEGEVETHFAEEWRTTLWVDGLYFRKALQSSREPMKSQYGRPIKPAEDINVDDFRLIVHEVSFCINLHLVCVAAECDLHAPVFDDPNCQFDAIARRNVYYDMKDMCPIAIILDDRTGRIVKVAIMRTAPRESLGTHLNLMDFGLSFAQSSSRWSRLEVQRLREIDVDEHESGSSTPLRKRLRSCVSAAEGASGSGTTSGGSNRRTANARHLQAAHLTSISITGRRNDVSGSGTANADSPRRRRRGRFDDSEDDEDYVPPSTSR